ncbi:MAG: chloride channel protein [Prolixibacteraceae bacterium]|nr:chloride channel protein [Prolixibacteraceae bacterium]
MGRVKNTLRRFNIWRIRNVSERQFVLILSVLVGAVSGFAAVILKNLIHESIEFIENHLIREGQYYYLLFPIIGIAFTYLFVKYVVKDNIGHGVTRVLYAISRNNSMLKTHNTWTSMIASTMTISFGGSVGAEAPVVLTGSAIGSNLARLFKLNYRQITLMVGCGAAAAVAGIFKAPLAGLLFTLEVLMLDLTMASLIPLMISAVTATTVAYFLMGDSVLFSFNLDNAFTVENIGYYIILGVFCGLISVYFTRMTIRIEGLFKKIIQPQNKLLVGGIVLTMLLFLFPALWGEGYNYIRYILNGEGNRIFQESIFSSIQLGSPWFIGLLFLVLLLKVVAMAATNGAGGVGGIFAPSLMIGSFSGFFLVLVFNQLLDLDLPVSNFTLAGMSGVMAGVMHAPMTAIFLIAEITGGYNLFLPLIVTATISYLTIMLFEPHSIYTKRMAERGELLTHHKDKNVLIMLNMAQLIEKEFVILREDYSLREFVKEIPQSKRNIFPVLDQNKQLVGVVLMENVRPIVFNTELYDNTYVSDFMISPPEIVDIKDNMETVMKKFNKTKAWNLPVTEHGEYRGFLSKSKIFNEYRDMLIHFSDD